MTAVSNYAEDAILDKTFRNTDFTVTTPYVSLHTAAVGETGANEATGGSYARQAGTFGAASGGTISNTATINFTSMPAATITDIGVWDAVSGGNFLWGGAATSTKTTNSGDTYQIGDDDLDITLD